MKLPCRELPCSAPFTRRPPRLACLPRLSALLFPGRPYKAPIAAINGHCYGGLGAAAIITLISLPRRGRRSRDLYRKKVLAAAGKAVHVVPGPGPPAPALGEIVRRMSRVTLDYRVTCLGPGAVSRRRRGLAGHIVYHVIARILLVILVRKAVASGSYPCGNRENKIFNLLGPKTVSTYLQS